MTGSVELLHITSLDNQLPAMAFGARPRHGEGMFSFTRDGREYVASLSTLAAEFGKTVAAFHHHAAARFHRPVPGATTNAW